MGVTTGSAAPRSRRSRFVVLAAFVALAALALLAARGGSGAPEPATATASSAPAGKAGKKKVPVIFVGNNWEGTADVLSVRRNRYRRIALLNIIPDLEERLDEINNPLNPNYDPSRLPYFLAINVAIGESHNQYVDDMYSTPDGKLLVVSRPSFKDVIALHIAGPRTGEIKWRFEVDGQRSDHMAVSPDGKQVAVSASTGNRVHLLNTKTGKEQGDFESGDSPHENTYSANGKRIYHASIGLVYTPADAPDADTTKGDRYFQVVRTRDQKILSRVDMGQKLEEAGYPGMSAAVRPMAISRNERYVFLQVSFYHGVVTYDLKRKKVLRITDLPNLSSRSEEEYLLDSAHHGIALSGDGKRLCVAGTESDYATIFRRNRLRKPSLNPKLQEKGIKPYWSTTSANGRLCYVSWSGTDDISVFRYRNGKEIRHVEVGDPSDGDPAGGQPAHPQRIRNGFVRRSFVHANRG